MRKQLLLSLWDWVTKPHHAIEETNRRRARFLSVLLGAFLILQIAAVLGAARLLYSTWNPFKGQLSLWGTFVLGAYLIEYLISRTKYFKLAVWALVATISLEIFGAMNIPPYVPILPAIFIFSLLINMYFLSWQETGGVFFAILVILWLTPFLTNIKPRVDIYAFQAFFFGSGILILAGSVVRDQDQFQIEQQSRTLSAQMLASIKTEKLLQQISGRFESLTRVATRLNSQLDMDSLPKIICEETLLALGFPAASVTLYDFPNDTSYFAASIGLDPEYTRKHSPFPRSLFEKYSSQMASVFVISDVQAEGFVDAELFARFNIRTIGTASITYQNELIGGLNIYSFETPRDLDANDRILFKGLADQAALAIVNSRLFSQTRRRLEQLQALRNIDRAITGSIDLRLTLNNFLDEVLKQLQVDAACILLFSPHSMTLDFAAGRGFLSGDIEHSSMRIGEGQAGLVAFDRRSVHIPHLSELAKDFGRASLLEDEKFDGYYGVPLVAKGQIRGVLEIFHRSTLERDAEWVNYLDALAGQAAIAIDNGTMFSDLQRSNFDLMIAYDSTLEGWSRALDLRDKETEGHTQRVTTLTLQLAKTMGLPETELANIRRGALLHDIGKMGIPDHILLKHDELSDDEWKQMRMHPVYAFEMLSPITYLRHALDIPYCHHEKWDGSGYPRGLKGEQIPLPARIFSVVDVWDALTTDRPYRKAWKKEQVIDHIRQRAGSDFDPKIVDAFLKLIAV